MRRTHYTKYNGDLASEMDLEDLLQGLSNYFLNSGFQDPYSHFQDLEQSLENLREALRQALENADFFDESMREKLDQMMSEDKLDEVIDKLRGALDHLKDNVRD